MNTTNVDLGDNRVWDLTVEAQRALSGDEEQVRRLLLASAGIPAVFPARGIGEYLYVDGAITGNIIYGARRAKRKAWWRAGTPSTRASRCRACATG